MFRGYKMDVRKIKTLIELINSSDIAEIEIKEGEESVRISRNSTVAPAMFAAPVAQAPIKWYLPLQPLRRVQLCNQSQGRLLNPQWLEHFIEPPLQRLRLLLKWDKPLP